MRTSSQPFGFAKQQDRFGHTGVRGDHPLPPSRQQLPQRPGAGSLSPRSSTGSAEPGRAGQWRCRPTAASYNRKVTEGCRTAEVSFSITVKLYKGLHKVIAAIAEHDWAPIPY
jgi:hypothetical protein